MVSRMTPAHLVRVLVALVCLAMLGPMGVAHADSSLHRDARGDVVVVVDNAPNRVVKRNRHADITQFRVTHDRSRVRVSMRVRNLKRRDFSFNANIRTPHRRFLFNLAKYGPVDQALLLDAQGDPVSCGGERHEVSYRRDLLSFSLPRTCLARPKWVRAGGVLTVAGKSGEYDHVDLSHRRGGLKGLSDIPVGRRTRGGPRG